jgi:hypothetical protein
MQSFIKDFGCFVKLLLDEKVNHENNEQAGVAEDKNAT